MYSFCFWAHLVYVLHSISINKTKDRFLSNNGVLYFKIKSSLSTIDPDGNGLYWCHSQDRTLRRHFGPGVKFAYSLKFRKNSNQTLHCALLIIAGDVATNPGPIQTSNGSDLNRCRRKSKLSVLYANARSIVNKTDKLCLEIESRSHDIVVLTETHLDDSILDSEIFPANFIVFRNYRRHLGRYGGGVLIAVRNTLKAHRRDDIACQSELLFADIFLKHNKKITIGVFYRPPNGDLVPLEDLQRVLGEISSTDLILFGDFNLSEIDWNNTISLRDSPLYNLLMAIVYDNFLTQMVNLPTRSQNILDLILTTSTDYVQDLHVGEPFSDHNQITFNINCAPYEERKPQKQYYSFKNAEWNNLKDLLLHIPWHCAPADDNIENSWITWKDFLLTAADDCIPRVNARKKLDTPWISKELIRLCRKKKAAYRKAKKTAKSGDWNYYRKLNSLVKNNCNFARREYINDLTGKLKWNDAKPFWKYVNSKRKGTNNLVLLKVENQEITDDLGIAESMNTYFSSVFTEEVFEYFPSVNRVVEDELCDIVCTTEEVEKYLKNLDVNKSPGPDGIPPRIVKECATQLAPSLTNLFNKIFSSGILPLDWKAANIAPIHKKKSKFTRENYRQISLTSIISKIGEKIVRDRSVDFWLSRQVFDSNQFGFLQCKSTVSQLLLCYNDWSKSRSNNKPTDVVFLDFCKAFDSVPHERLLYKLSQHGIGGALLEWFRNFLTNRRQRVVVRGTYSGWSNVKSGVPQGTILGPILFLIYINDLPNGVSSSVKLFADDTKIYRELSDVEGDALSLQSDLNRMSCWAKTWQMSFNPEKCEVMRITHQRDLSVPIYHLFGKPLKVVNKFKDLGIIMSNNLKWSEHVNTIVNKANRILGLIKRTVGPSNTVVFTLLYKALVRPILEYASPVWSPYLVKDIKALEGIQRRASRMALKQKRGDMPYDQRCKLLKWNSLEKRRVYLSLVECYKTVFNLNGITFDEIFEYKHIKKTRANHKYTLYTKLPRINCYKHSFFVRIINQWNTLPSNVVEVDNLRKFKSQLMLHMDLY